MWQRYRNILFSTLAAVIAALSAYFTTIGSLKIELATKAEEAFVASLDKRISNLEVRLADQFATKEDFYTLREELIVSLSRIEFRLQEKEHTIEH